MANVHESCVSIHFPLPHSPALQHEKVNLIAGSHRIFHVLWFGTDTNRNYCELYGFVVVDIVCIYYESTLGPIKIQCIWWKFEPYFVELNYIQKLQYEIWWTIIGYHDSHMKSKYVICIMHLMLNIKFSFKIW